MGGVGRRVAHGGSRQGRLVAEGDLAARTPGAQRATLPVAGAAPGSHPYRVEFVNAAGVTSSDTLTVRVTH